MSRTVLATALLAWVGCADLDSKDAEHEDSTSQAVIAGDGSDVYCYWEETTITGAQANCQSPCFSNGGNTFWYNVPWGACYAGGTYYGTPPAASQCTGGYYGLASCQYTTNPPTACSYTTKKWVCITISPTPV